MKKSIFAWLFARQNAFYLCYNKKLGNKCLLLFKDTGGLSFESGRVK